MALIECLLFVAGRPLAVRELARALQAPRGAVEAAIAELATRGAGRGLIVQRLGDQVQLVTHPAASSLVQRFLGQEVEAGLSTATLETAAVIAYQQPITRADIEAVRGTSCERPLAQLMARSLIRVLSRRQSPGRPFEYGTTFEFLQAFGLRSLDDLPPIEQQSTALGEQPA